MNKVQGLILLCAGLTLAAVGGSFATGYIMGQADAKVAKQPVSTIYQSGRYSVDLPEDLQGSNIIAGTLLQVDSICTDSVIHCSFFNGIATYGDGSDAKHPIQQPLRAEAMFGTE